MKYNFLLDNLALLGKFHYYSKKSEFNKNLISFSGGFFLFFVFVSFRQSESVYPILRTY